MPIIRAALAAAVLGTIVTSWVQAGQQATAQASPTAPGQSTPRAPAGNADRGREAYREKGCYACHGLEGQGSPATGPRLGPNPVPLVAFTRYVRGPAGGMPPYTEQVVSDAELADMHAFLQARPGPASIDSLPPSSVVPPK